MSKFKVSVSYSLETRVEPDGVERRITDRIEDADGIVSVDDSSYLGDGEVTSDGGEVEVIIEADSEDEAEERVREQFQDGFEVEDYNGLTWVASNVYFEVEREEMDEDEAKRIVRALLQRLADNGTVSEDEREAITVVLDLG